MLPPGTEETLIDAGTYFLQLSAVVIPLFLLASFLVGLAQEYISPEQIEEALRERSEGSGNVAAATLGAVTPFCSCSSIPVTAGMVQSGAPVGLILSFLIASPLINEIAVPLLIGLFGLQVALLYVAITFTSAVVVGIVLGRYMDLDAYVKDLESLDAISNRGMQTMAADGGVATATQRSRSHWEHFVDAAGGARLMISEIWKYVLLGLTVAAIIHSVVPVDWLQAVLGPSNPVAVPLAVLAGVPLYLDITAMLPIAAAFVERGIPIGTVLALLVGVVGVSLPELIMLSKMFERRLLALFVVAVSSIGILTGILFNYLLV